MDRYRSTKTITEPDTKKQYMESTIYPKVQASDNDFYVISDEGDRLDLLAYKYYNDVSMWWVIAVANNLNDANFYVEPGIQLRIPANIDKINNDLAKINK
jgi:hypothetical protein